MTLNKRIQFIRQRANGKAPSNYPRDGAGIPLRITRLFPMKLKDVDVNSLDQGRSISDVVCLTEMMSLFECFEKNEFNKAPCQAQVKSLENCYSSFQAKKAEKKAKRLSNKNSK